jgi:predicted transposase/invertase (TIGR01784 family)
MTELLDPKLDVIFKAMMAQQSNEDVRISLITAITMPVRPIISAKVLNPELPRKHITDKGVILDILVQLGDGSYTNIEMQMNWHRLLSERAHYYAARLFGSQLKKGFQYQKLKPTTSIFLLGDRAFRESPDHVFHYKFRMREDQNHAELSPLMTMHFIEIPKLFTSLNATVPLTRNLPLEDWCRFLYNPNDPLLELEVFPRMPEVKKAHESLKYLSDNVELQEIARIREKARLDYDSFVQAAFDEGEAKGKAEGRAEGEARGKAEGRAEGEARGKAEGRAEGEAKGKAEGRAEAQTSFLVSLLKNPETRHLGIKELAAFTGLSETDISNQIALLHKET